jgi:uncharacterized protein (DUF433 family)
LEAYLRRVERDPVGVPIRLFPFATLRQTDDRPIVIDPRVRFGRPCIAGTGIPTVVIHERFRAGDDMDEIAADYGRDRGEIEKAIRYETLHAAA